MPIDKIKLEEKKIKVIKPMLIDKVAESVWEYAHEVFLGAKPIIALKTPHLQFVITEAIDEKTDLFNLSFTSEKESFLLPNVTLGYLEGDFVEFLKTYYVEEGVIEKLRESFKYKENQID